MLKWIKESLFGKAKADYEDGSTVLPKVSSIPPMPKVKPPKGKGSSSKEYQPKHLVVKLPDISEPVISFVDCVRKNPKRFEVASDSSYTLPLERNNNNAYKIWDREISKGWSIKEDNYFGSFYFFYSDIDKKFYEDAFFLTSNEKEYLIKEVSAIMNYRVDRKAKLDNIRADRRIRDTRNKLKGLYCGN